MRVGGLFELVTDSELWLIPMALTTVFFIIMKRRHRHCPSCLHPPGDRSHFNLIYSECVKVSNLELAVDSLSISYSGGKVGRIVGG